MNISIRLKSNFQMNWCHQGKCSIRACIVLYVTNNSKINYIICTDICKVCTVSCTVLAGVCSALSH